MVPRLHAANRKLLSFFSGEASAKFSLLLGAAAVFDCRISQLPEEFDRPGENPVTGEPVVARRRRIRQDLELPVNEDYSAFLRNLMIPK